MGTLHRVGFGVFTLGNGRKGIGDKGLVILGDREKRNSKGYGIRKKGMKEKGIDGMEGEPW